MMAVPLKHTDFGTVKIWLDRTFDVFGFPTAVKSDNGPPFNSIEWRKYCSDRGIQAVFSWPLTPQQNGMAERAMATIGKAMRTSAADKSPYVTTLAEAIKAHNASAHRVTNEVPENVMFGRRIRRSLPLMKSAVVEIDSEEMCSRDWSEKMKAKEREDAKRNARPSQVTVGDHVVLRRESKRKGDTIYEPTELVVVAQKEGDLTLQAPDGHLIRRNITKTKKVVPEDVSVSPTAPVPLPTGSTDGSDRPRRVAVPPKRYKDYVRMVSTEEINDPVSSKVVE